MTTPKLTNLGTAIAIVLPVDVLAPWGVGPGDALKATETLEDSLLPTAGRPDRAQVSDMINEIMNHYDNTFRALAR